MTYNKSIINGINYLITPEDSTVQTLETSCTTKFSGLSAILLGVVKTFLWSAIAVIVPAILL